MPAQDIRIGADPVSARLAPEASIARLDSMRLKRIITCGIQDMSSCHSRKNLRLPTWDYRQPSLYIVTVCVHRREHRFGSIENESMHRNDAGDMVANICEEIPKQLLSVALDEYVIMPNHVHGIIGVNLEHWEAPEMALGSVMQWFKTVTTNHYIRGIKTEGWPRFDGLLWQRNYYETIIRNEAMLKSRREYIAANPANWRRDKEHTPS